MEKFAGGTIAVICGSILVNGDEDLSLIKKNVNQLYQINTALRIEITEMGHEVSQTVCDYSEQDFNVLKFHTKDELDSYARNYAKTPLDSHGNLCEINIVLLPERYGLLIKLHHIIGDAWTLSLLGNQFMKMMKGEDVTAYSYIDYVKTESTYLQSKRYEKDKEFFVEQFKKCDEVTYLSDMVSNSVKACRKTFVIGKDNAKIIKTYAQKKGVSVFVLFTAVFSVYMNRLKMNSEKFYIGTTVLNRSGMKEKNMAGMFINTVPMLMELDNSKSFAENLFSIDENSLLVLRHQKYNYGEVLSTIRKVFGFKERLYDVVISYQNATVTGDEIETTWYPCGTQSESLQIHIEDRDNKGCFYIHFDYQKDKFTVNDIENMYHHFCNLLFSAIADDSKKLYELNLLSQEEKQKYLLDYNDTAVVNPVDISVYQLFEKQVHAVPNKIAVRFKNLTITYCDLEKLVQNYANKLISCGIKSGDIVAVHLQRSYKLIVFQLAILKIGAVFLPVDKRYPTERIDYMCMDCDVKLMISDERMKNKINTNIFTIEDFENIVAMDTAESVVNRDVCYIIYTSGSTGNPKGCMLTGKGITNFCINNNTHETLDKLDDCVFACVNSVSFDYFIAESLLPLTNGFTTVILDDDESTMGQKFLDIVAKNNVNVVMTTPTRLKIYFDDKCNCEALKQLECICTSGEPLTHELLAQIYDKAPKAQVYNPLGPSECSVWDLGGKLERKDKLDIHIGKPIANTQVYIVDKYLKMLPVGITGELCIAGEGVGAGYINRPKLTDEKFVDNPFGEGKLYKTGDLAYWREDGNVAYVGRNDYQVKIRGLRIELGEIENVICDMDGISQVVVVVRKNKENRQLICAFYSGDKIDAKDIRSNIGKKLPSYMLPHVYFHLDEMPLTSSGKINRRGLPEIDLENILCNMEYVAPESSMQGKVCKIMEEVLGTSPIGIEDNFFDLCGDSLNAIELVSTAHNEGIYFNLQNVFDFPTIKELCKCIESDDKKYLSYADIDFMGINDILQKNRIENIALLREKDVGNILLAGATGYLGIHILADFLDNDNGLAYCLVRGKDKMDSTTRLKELLAFYFDKKYIDMNRIEVICADLQRDGMGLTDLEYKKLLQKVDTVINCAANVKHYGTYRYFKEINVDGTKRLVQFCKESNAKLIHISTLTISGNGFENKMLQNNTVFTERSFYIGQSLVNVYARSKFEAERVVLDAMTDGLSANIMRMGNLTNRVSDGVFQRNYKSNAFLKRIKALIDLGVYPDSLSDLEVEFTPVDEAARAVMVITRNFNNLQTVFHINNPKTIKVKDVFEMLAGMNHSVEKIPYEDFERLLYDSSNQNILNAFINDMNEEYPLNYDSNIHIQSDFTVQYLKQYGFEWIDVGIDYLRKYVEYFEKLGD